MKRLTILAIIVWVGLLLTTDAVAGNPQGPPGGLGVEIVNPLPVPITGDVDATVSGDVNATVSGDVNVVNQPSIDAVQSGSWNVTVENDSTEPVPVTITNTVTKTHMGVQPSDHVHLKCWNRNEFKRVRVTGNPEPIGPDENWEVPEGKMLILTDFFGRVRNATPQASIYVRVDGCYGGVCGFESIFINGVADINGDGYINNSLSSGMVFPSGTHFSVGDWSGDFEYYSTQMYGYLIDSDK